MSADIPPRVDVDVIARAVGAAAFQRGQAYARRGAVLETEWDPAAGLLTGTVQGTTRRPYRTSVAIDTVTSGRARSLSGSCSCPIGVDCKHVAAILVAANTLRLLHDRTNGTEMTAAADIPAWQTAVTNLATRASAPADHAPLGLLLELRRMTSSGGRYWQSGPTAKVATSPLEPQADYRLAARPVTRGTSGAWVRSDVTWGTVAYRARRASLDPTQQSWFAQFAALHRSTRATYAPAENDWLYLDDFESPLLWPLLQDAAILGIAVIAGRTQADVTVLRDADLVLDAARTENGIRLTQRVLVGDVDAGIDDGSGATIAAPIGDHGIYTYRLDPQPAVTLAALRRPIGPEQRRLLSGPPITIPIDDADGFLATHLPALRRALSVTSRDSSVVLPDLAAPILVLSATFGTTLQLEWTWDYDGRRLPLSGATGLVRDLDAEIYALNGIRCVLGSGDRSWAILGEPHLAPEVTLTGIDAAEFTTGPLPEIEKLDRVRVETAGERPDYRELLEAPRLTMTTVATDHRDWFDLGVLVTVEGRTVPFAPLLAALTRGESTLLLIDNSYLSLRQPAFDELRRLVEEAGELAEWETGMRISRYQAALWSEFEDLADETVQATAWRAAVEGLLATDDQVSIPIPKGLNATLRPYQREGFSRLAFWFEHGLGGILGDDMGLGKTLQTLALVLHAPRGMPFLVVAPTSVVGNWVAEAERYTPDLAVCGIGATERKSGRTLRDQTAGADVVVTSYALFRLDQDAYRNIPWAGLILDEAQFIKNPASKAYRMAVELETPFKLALTGTPIQNGLIDLWALLAVVAPGLFASRRRFQTDYVDMITQTESPERAAETLAKLQRRVRPLLLRRTKEQVATELPEKQEQVLRVDLAPGHRRLYDTVLQHERQKLLGLIDDLDRHRFTVFRSLTLLRMLSLDAALIDETHAHLRSAKLDALLEQLDDVVAEGHRALVFSQFTSFLRRAADRLEAAGIACAYLDGSTLRRSAVIDRFRDGDAPVFLISLKAGGVGLNLTEADYVFLLDPWWNPAAEAQAVDRTHRIGQTRPVNVYRLVSAGTIEEKVMALRDRKAALADAVLDDEAAFGSALSAEDIRGLLQE